MGFSGSLKHKPGSKRQPQETDLEIGKRIWRVRNELFRGELRQEDFGAKLGVSRGAVSNWEAGKGVRRVNLERIAEEYEVSIDWLMFGRGQPRLSTTNFDSMTQEARVDLQGMVNRLPFAEREAFYREMEAIMEVMLKTKLARLEAGQNDD